MNDGRRDEQNEHEEPSGVCMCNQPKRREREREKEERRKNVALGLLNNFDGHHHNDASKRHWQ
jgi:hypothetical protein